MANGKIIVRQGTIAEAMAISDRLPEFDDPYPASVYQDRLAKVPSLILVAECTSEVAGFKVGYERDGYWYSWLGGVLPQFRRQGIAQELAEAQEKWARQQGYPSVTMKTRNRHRGMLFFALGRGFNFIGIDPAKEEAEHRIWLRKSL